MFSATLRHKPTGIHVFKVNNGNTITMSEICSKITIKDTRTMPMIAFVVKFEQMSLAIPGSAFVLLTLRIHWL